MCTFKLGARSKFSTNPHETDNSVNVKNTNIVAEKIVWISHLCAAIIIGPTHYPPPPELAVQKSG
jgi:hypothetical protein